MNGITLTSELIYYHHIDIVLQELLKVSKQWKHLIFLWLHYLLLKQSLHSDGQQFHQYQQYKQSPLTANNWTHRRPWHMPLKIQVLALYMYRHKNVVWLNQLIESQPSLGNMEFWNREFRISETGKVEIWKQETWKFETGNEKFLNKKFTPIET